mmetsp:Transcript_20864/g.51228  ORF Transcript_20864/g.51228 Transcript_20864/m.51228 type:complete len:1124 (+) Transcript_20864:1238-4609(+)
MPNTQREGFKLRAPPTPKPTNPVIRKFSSIPYHSPLPFPPSLIRWLCLFLIFNTTTPLSSLAHPQPKTQLQPHQHQYLDSPVIAETYTGANATETNSTGETVFECDTTAITIEKMSIPGLNEDDKKFIDRIQSSIQTVMTWEKDIELIKACREEIPWEMLADPNGPYSDPVNDNNLQGNLLFLQRLCRWFKSYMTWVNAPPCQVCGHEELEFKVVRGPETDEEKEGGAKRVEVYYCPRCDANTTTFPRYNSPKKLLETKKGRCGEYSNLFGLFCRSTGLETRLVLDLSDHLWTEVYIGEQDSWVMADGCEGVIAEPSMYEHGWGKKELCYMVGIAQDHILDVTPRYTRAFLSEEFQNRRRIHTSSEDISRQIFQHLNQTMLQSQPKFRQKALEMQNQVEQAELQLLQQATRWTEQEIYGRGRISGSLEWKQARHEDGKKANGDSNTDQINEDAVKEHVAGFQIQSFYPPILDEKLSLAVKPNPLNRHDAIVVANTPCAIGEEETISVVVVDESYLGCILQSRSFRNWEDAQEFVNHIPPHRIVLCHGKCPNASRLQESRESGTDETRDKTSGPIDMARLGGWKGENVLDRGVVYVGQVDAHPDWSFCTTIDDCPKGGHEVVLQSIKDLNEGNLKSFLKTESKTAPRRVSGRLPDSIMPLKTQLMASGEQKKMAYESFPLRNRYSGYTTKPNAPVYLLGSKAYPFQRLSPLSVDKSNDDVWSTFHYLPSPLVPELDKEAPGSGAKATLPSFDVPLDLSFFQSSVGAQLLANDNTRLTLSDALQNSRLIAFYFSAHWCGPCRSFTPMLAEMYEHLKEVRPTHGLEIVFVSSDRDPNSFQQYFSTMPWKAIPFDSLPFVKQSLNATYGVQGIPSLVVLDAVSGRVVVSPNESRQAVATACQRGEEGIERMMESWLERVPPETAELLSMLQLSCEEDMLNKRQDDVGGTEYLASAENLKPKPFDPASRIKEIFETYTAEGMDPTQAAAKAIGSVAEEQKKEKNGLDAGPLYGRAIQIGPHSPGNKLDQAFSTLRYQNSQPVATEALSTALKYVRNASKEPWTPKFRTFKLSNKIADAITRAEGAIEVLEGLGFDIFGTRQDFKATIPAATDLGAMESKLTDLLNSLD